MSWADDMWNDALAVATRMLAEEQAITKMDALDAAVAARMSDKQLVVAHFTKQYPYMAALRLDNLREENEELKKQLTEKS